MTTYLDAVVLLDFWVGVADGSAIVGHNIRNFVLAETLALHLAKLETCFLSIDGNWLEATLDVIQYAEVFVGFWDLNDIHKAERVTWVSSDSVVNFDIAFSFSADFNCLMAGESVFKSVLEKNCQRDTLSKLMRASRWAGCINTS